MFGRGHSAIQSFGLNHIAASSALIASRSAGGGSLGSGSRWWIATATRNPSRFQNPHAFTAYLQMGGQSYAVDFVEHEQAHSATTRDNNMRAAIIHVIADAAVSVCVIVGLLLARAFGWLCTRVPNCAAAPCGAAGVGNGNGQLANLPNTVPAAGTEGFEYFPQLAAADLITGISISLPPSWMGTDFLPEALKTHRPTSLNPSELLAHLPGCT
jgi:hypothetical protein